MGDTSTLADESGPEEEVDGLLNGEDLEDWELDRE